MSSFFPLWKYLSQPIFKADSPLILHPRQFWFVYRVKFLEVCLEQDASNKRLH